MSDDPFFERLRKDADALRFDVPGAMSRRISARIRERITAREEAGVAQLLARWFRPVGAALAAFALAALLGIGWLEQSPDMTGGSTGVTLDSVSGTQTVDVSVGGDTFNVE
jgi:hypothetical protein